MHVGRWEQPKLLEVCIEMPPRISPEENYYLQLGLNSGAAKSCGLCLNMGVPGVTIPNLMEKVTLFLTYMAMYPGIPHFLDTPMTGAVDVAQRMAQLRFLCGSQGDVSQEMINI